MRYIYFTLILANSLFFSNQVIAADNWKLAYPAEMLTTKNKLNEVPSPRSLQTSPRARREYCWGLEDNKRLQNVRIDCEIKVQEKQYCGRIIGTDYKESIHDVPSQDIKGFFVQILCQKIDNQIIPECEEIAYLPYVVILKQELVTVFPIRNSGGTLLGNLAINLNGFIEFDKLSSAKLDVKDAGTQEVKSYRVITSRPIESKVSS